MSVPDYQNSQEVVKRSVADFARRAQRTLRTQHDLSELSLEGQKLSSIIQQQERYLERFSNKNPEGPSAQTMMRLTELRTILDGIPDLPFERREPVNHQRDVMQEAGYNNYVQVARSVASRLIEGVRGW